MKLSKYTTEVRFICEQMAGLDSSVGYNSVDTVLNESWDKVFDFDFPIFDENYRKGLCKKILKHFYVREIGMETVGLWKLMLDTRMNEIMPYYNKLYESELLKVEPLTNYSYEKSGEDLNETKGDDSRTSTKGGSDTTQFDTSRGTTLQTNDKQSTDRVVHTVDEQTSTKSENLKEMYSDTPQGAITNVENGSYLTNATVNNNSGSNQNKGTNNESTHQETKNNNKQIQTGQENTNQTMTYGSTESIRDTNKVNTTKEYIERVTGFNGTSQSKLLLEFRDTFLNIDMLIIENLNDLFMNLW